MKQALGFLLPCIFMGGCATAPHAPLTASKPPSMLIGTPTSEITTPALQALAAGPDEGQMLLRFTVKADGSVLEPRVMFSKLPAADDAVVIAALQQWRFKPALAGGLPVDREFIYPLFFGAHAHQESTRFFCHNQAEIYAPDRSCEIVTAGHWRIYRMNPVYPPELLSRHLAGSVTLSFDIGPQGQVTNPKVTSATPAGLFDAAALAAVKRWYFEPLDANSADGPAQQVSVTVKFTPPMTNGGGDKPNPK